MGPCERKNMHRSLRSEQGINLVCAATYDKGMLRDEPAASKRKSVAHSASASFALRYVECWQGVMDGWLRSDRHNGPQWQHPGACVLRLWP